MNNTLVKYSLQVIIMLAFLSKAFAFSSTPNEPVPLKPRQINLSGEIFSFSMPENFSTDMPAKDMIESVDLTDKRIFEKYQEFTLIRRWWDFKDKGFFAKDYGSVMMSMYIKQVPENSEYDILDPLGFIGTIIRDFNDISQNDTRKNDSEKPLTLYPDFYEAYKIETINSLHWFNYPVEEKVTNEFIINYAIPITPQHYFVVSFSLSPSYNVSTRQFIEEYGRPHINAIINTFTIQFSPKSKLPSINSQSIDLNKLIEEKFYSGQEPVKVNGELLNSLKHIETK